MKRDSFFESFYFFLCDKIFLCEIKLPRFECFSVNCFIQTNRMKSDPRLNWSFDSSIRYSGLSRYLLSSSRRLSRSYRRELLLFVSSPSSSSRQLPRSTRREFLLLDSSIPSSSRRLLRPPHYVSLHLRLVKCRVRLVDP